MKYNNPIIGGFHPDPSICRVGADYYLATSSFEYFPGIPVFHSRDLIHWEQIGNCVAHAAELEPEGMSFAAEGFRAFYGNIHDSGGIWAPTIRYEKGLFYVTATVDGCGNFITRSSNPSGPWSKPVWVPVGGIDPSLFFENGKDYYCTNQSLHPGQEEITMCEINPETGELLSGQRTLWNGIGGGFLEGPHLYHIDGFYYLLAAEGGTSFNHMITLARSGSLWGPYEGCPWNPILTNVHDTGKQVQCSGHGDLVKDCQGNFWIVHLATRLSRRTMTHLGRETFLTPARWVDGWLYADNDKKASLVCEGPLQTEPAQTKQVPQPAVQEPTQTTTQAKQMPQPTVQESTQAKQMPQPAIQEHAHHKKAAGEASCVWQADFRSCKWEPEWIFLRAYHKSSYRRGDGILNLYPAPVSLSDKTKSPTFAAVRQPDFDFELEAGFTFPSSRIGDEAGLALRLSSDFYYCFCIRRTGEGIFLCAGRKIEDIWHTDCEIALPSMEDSPIFLKIQGCKEYYLFSYALGDSPDKPVINYRAVARPSTRFLSTDLAGRCFTGTVMGLYALCGGKTDSVMRVSRFCVRTGP